MRGEAFSRYRVGVAGLILVGAAVVLRTALAPTPAGPVVINEVLASNGRILADEEGDPSDWIELYNPTTAPVSLEGYGLSDQEDGSDRWIFPAITLQPRTHLLVWASRKARIFLGERGAVEPLEVNFDGAGEEDGDYAEISVNGTDLSENRPGINVVRLSREGAFVESRAFGTHESVGASAALALYLRGLPRGAIVALAGRGRGALRLTPDAAAALQELGSRHADSMEPNDSWGMVSVVGQGRVVEAHAEEDYGSAWGSASGSTELHAPFALRRIGETLSLYAPDGSRVDSVVLGEQVRNISYGRRPDGAGQWCFMSSPTPRADNSAFCARVSESPAVAPASGFYDGPVVVSLGSSSVPEIRYTLDGSEPTRGSSRYAGPLTITETTIVRARGFGPGLVPGGTVTRSYLVGEKVALPVVSLVTDPENLWDERRGIHVEGPDILDPNFDQHGRRWERPVDVQFFEDDHEAGFEIRAGLRIFGGAVREYPKKCFILHFRGTYGRPALEYDIFPDGENRVFRNLVLRNGGDDGQTDLPRMRDGLMHALWGEEGGVVSARRPVFVYLNGKPWGIYNIRERIDAHYLAANYGIREADLIRGEDEVLSGDRLHWERTFSFLESHDLREADNLAKAGELLDLDNVTDFWIFQIYSGNIDLEEANLIKFRPRTPGGKWRWAMWDMDVSFGLVSESQATHDTLAWYTRDGPMPGLGIADDDGGTSLWATLVLRRLLEVESYRARFITRFADLLNTTLAPDHVLALVDAHSAEISRDIATDVSLWAEEWGMTSWNSRGGWTDHVDEVRHFARQRPTVLRRLLMEKFDLNGMVTLTVHPPSSGEGAVRVNTVGIETLPWRGVYFSDLPFRLEAVPAPGHEFIDWGNAAIPADPVLDELPRGGLQVRPRFAVRPRG